MSVQRPMRIWSGAMALLSAIALFIAVYLTIHALNGTETIGCAAGSSCDRVLGSRWSMLFGLLPVSALASSVYAVTLCCALLLLGKPDPETDRLVPPLLFVLSGAIVGSAVWFTILQVAVLHAFCPYCMASHVAGVLLAVLVWAVCRPGDSRRCRLLLIAAGVAAALLLAAVQWFTTPQTVYARGYTEAPLPDPDKADTPYLGRPDAPHTCYLLFDYQCSHCQRMHGLVRELTAAYGDSLCVRLCPTPLSPACNPYVSHASKDLFEGSCDLARMAEALWLTDTSAFYAFDAYLFGIDREGDAWKPRPVEAARNRAVRLVGEKRLDEALRSERLARNFATFAELFGRTSMSGQSGIPRLIYGAGWIIPDAEDVTALKTLLDEVFGIRLE
ncbi:MAG: thioredoxin domain-containing protein [Bacteroidales bacterium]|nr:thioredoxin domain-containing protein [Bacteroidales bacterium]